MPTEHNTSLKNYQILDLLKDEQSSKTFLVKDLQNLTAPPLILKQYFPVDLTEENLSMMEERFKQEVNILGNLSQNNVQIPNIYDHFREEQSFCLVQEWIEGKSLALLIKEKGIFSEKQVKELLLRILPVLNYIHSQGIVHGNLSPNNIILEEGTGLPVLINFASIIHLFSASTPPPDPLGKKLGYHSDLYDLGLIAIFLLTGMGAQDFPINQLTGEIIWHPQDVKISDHLVQILNKAIQPKVSERYHNGKEMLLELQTKVSSQVKSSYSPYQELFESNMKDKNPFALSPMVIATTGFALLVVGGLFYNHQVTLSQKRLIEEKQTEISEVESKTPSPTPEEELVNMKPQEPKLPSDTPGPTTEPLPYYPSDVTPPATVPPAIPQTSTAPSPTNANYIDIGWSTRQTWAAKMPTNSIALTFDDGPHPQYTPQILDILQKNNIKATFFLVGKRVEARCDLVKRIVAEGHEIANHTYTHPFLTKISSSRVQEELEKTQQAIANCVGFRPKWFRAPYGDQSESVLKIAHTVGLNTVLWTVDTDDWRAETTSEKIRDTVLESDGQDIVLMHDSTEASVDFAHDLQNAKAAKTRDATINSLEGMIEGLKNKNMTFLTISEAFPDAP